MSRTPLSLRGHLILLIAGAVLPGALLTGLLVRQTLVENRAAMERQFLDAARVDADAVDREFAGTIRALQALGASPSLDSGDLQSFHAEASRVVRAQRGWFAVILLDPEAQQLVHTGRTFGEPLLTANEPESVEQTVRDLRPSVGPLRPGRGEDTKPRFPIRVPVLRGGRLVYVLTAVMEPESIASIAASPMTAEEWTRTIVDSESTIAARSHDAVRFVGRRLTAGLSAAADGSASGVFREQSVGGEPIYGAMARGQYGWSAAVVVPIDVLDTPIRASVIALIAGASALVIAGLVSVLIVSRRVTKDLSSARQAAAALAEGRMPQLVEPQVAEGQELRESLTATGRLLQTQQRERDEQVERARAAQAQAEAASRTKDQFLAVLGHELRNPLAPAMTALELMKMKAPDTLVRERGVLERQIAHMARLVDDLLDVSRLTRGKVELRRRRFETRIAIDRAIDMARPLIDQHRHELRVDAPASGLLVDADEARVVQIIANLLTNATRYTPPGSHIELAARAALGAVVIACADDGPGIPPELVPTLFEAFAQGPRTIDRPEGGLGLGLSLARTLAEMHGGSLRYERRQPNGSRFTLTLPAAQPATLAAAEQTHDAVPGGVRRKMLIVEDSADAREMLQAALQEAGHEVVTAADAYEALSIAPSFQPEVAILDIGLPGMDGYELARRLRREHRRIRLVALTGYGQPADTEAARQAGFDAHCTKPVTVATLIDRIESIEPSSGGA